ncbi:MAG: DUF5131 family protein [Rhodanobacter sp.]
MADHSRIEWTEATWNPLIGCSRVSTGCRGCYAERMAARFAGEGQLYQGLIHPSTRGWNGTVRLMPDVLTKPLRWKRPRRIFVNSMSDLFHESVPDAWIDQIFAIMALSPHHTFQILTKRAERMRRYLDGVSRHQVARAALQFTGRKHPNGHDCDPVVCNTTWPLPNVWLGVSVENQETADERIPLLLQTHAAVRWLSCEPLLGPVDLTSVAWPDKDNHYVDVLRGGYWNAEGHLALGPSAALGAQRGGFTNHSDMNRIDWVVVGGESGPGARPMHRKWVLSLRDQCQADGAHTPFFFKQWGEWAPATSGIWFYMIGDDAPFAPRATSKNTHRFGDGFGAVRIGKKRTGRLLDGVLHNAYPEVSHG